MNGYPDLSGYTSKQLRDLKWIIEKQISNLEYESLSSSSNDDNELHPKLGNSTVKIPSTINAKRQKPISKAQRYWNNFGPELYEDATGESQLTHKQLIEKYGCQLENGEKLSDYMVSALIGMGKRLEGIAK